MTKSERLLALLQLLRGCRHPVSAACLASQLDVSLRTLYRDIASLQAQGAAIVGEAGLGYVLQPGYLLPPLMFRDEELEALVLGMRWVVRRGDGPLAAAAKDVLAKVAHVLPDAMRDSLAGIGLAAVPAGTPPGPVDTALLRQAIRGERKLEIVYRDGQGRESTRLLWPLLIGYFDHVLMLAAWCELRGAFRNFRVDRMADARLTETPFPRRRRVLLKEWHAVEEIPAFPV